MAVSEGQMYSLLIRQRKLERKIEELYRAIDGGNTRFEDAVCAYGPYSDRSIRAFTRDVVSAYSVYVEAAYHLDTVSLTVGSRADLFNPDEWTEEEIEEALERGPLNYLDKEQQVFLENMLYCMVRLVVESPFYDGMYAELARECRGMLAMLKNGPTIEEFAEGVARRQQLDGPRKALDAKGFMDRRFPFTLTYSMFPMVSWSAPAPWPEGAFIPDLDSIYELLGGKPIDELATKAQLRDAAKRIAADAAGAAEARDADTSGENPASMDDSVKQRMQDEEEFRVREAKNIAQWVEAFPRKDAWCKAYASMCKAFFKLGGLRPASDEFDWESWTAAEPISAESMEHALEAVLDDCRFSHFTDDIFEALYENLSTATVRACRSIMQRRRVHEHVA